MPRALILLPLMLVIQGAILYLLLQAGVEAFPPVGPSGQGRPFLSAPGSGPHTGTGILFDF